MKKIFSILLAVLVITMAVLPVSAASNSFVPSIDNKYYPKIVYQTDSKGNRVGAIIYDKNGHEIIGVPVEDVIITPISGSSKADKIIREALEYAQKQIKDSKNLGSLTDEVNDYLNKNYPGMSLDDLAVSQLFDVRLSSKYLKYLTDGAYFNIKFDLGESFLFLLLLQNQDWSVCKDYKLDGNVVTLNLLGPTQVALVQGDYTPEGVPADNQNAVDVKSPKTGNYTDVLLISLGVLFAIGGTLLIVMYAKNKGSKKR